MGSDRAGQALGQGTAQGWGVSGGADLWALPDGPQWGKLKQQE